MRQPCVQARQSHEKLCPCSHAIFDAPNAAARRHAANALAPALLLVRPAGVLAVLHKEKGEARCRCIVATRTHALIAGQQCYCKELGSRPRPAHHKHLCEPIVQLSGTRHDIVGRAASKGRHVRSTGSKVNEAATGARVGQLWSLQPGTGIQHREGKAAHQKSFIALSASLM